MSKTVQNYINDIVRKVLIKENLQGLTLIQMELLLIDEIMQAGTPVKDTVLRTD